MNIPHLVALLTASILAMVILAAGFFLEEKNLVYTGMVALIIVAYGWMKGLTNSKS